MENRDLLRRLRKLGFPFFETGELVDVNRALADMAQSKDLRFWEAFPAVLASSAEKGLFDYKKTAAYLKNQSGKKLLASLAALSLALFKELNMDFSWADSLHDLLSPKTKKEYEAFCAALKQDKNLKVAGRDMSPKRLKTALNNYLRKQTAGLRDLLSVKEDMGLDYALSQVFSPKQKELFLKKLRGDVLTKTEREYFSRAVKKKVLALANSDLHRLSRKLLGE